MTWCDHQQTEIRRKTSSTGVAIFKMQCVRCGMPVGNSLAYSQIPDMQAVPKWDEGAYQRFASEMRRNYERQQEQIKSEWWNKYYAYVSSSNPVWQDKRRRVFERDKWLCQACLRRGAEQVHHLSYKHLGNEPLFELVSVCRLCHEAIHSGRGEQ